MNQSNPEEEIEKIRSFLQKTFQTQGKKNAVIAVSGGIDSALSLTLLTKAIGKEFVFPLFLPYGDQSVEDSMLIAKWNNIPEKNWRTIDIKRMVDVFSDTLCHPGTSSDEEPYPGSSIEKIRIGNIMARTRMIVVFDTAKELDALVCGTENKSEHYLGYFTRFGDSASDIEPICHLYKTQVRQLASFLNLPEVFVSKAPSAGLWDNQTDEQEMGFSYEDADKALSILLQESSESIDPKLLKKVKKTMESQAFKLQVPYVLFP